MGQLLSRLWVEQDGQDLIEYTLLMAFVMFTIIGLATGFSGSIAGITSISNSQITYANGMLQNP